MTTDFRALCFELTEALCGYEVTDQDVALIDHARAALAEPEPEGPTPQPVPVSERLPGAGDCTPQGWCWVLYRGFSTWTLEPPLGRDGQPTGWTHWLPAHALPLPTSESD